MNRTINFTVNSSGTVSCNGSLRPQIAGVQGDRNVCTVNFDLTAIWDGTANYFLEFVSGTNVPYILTTDSDGVTLDTTNHKISVVLSQEITADGGRVEVNVVQEKIDSENETSHESNTYTAYIYFEPKSGAIQKLKNTAYGIFDDIKKTVTSFITTMTTAFNELQGDYAEFTESVNDSIEEIQEDVEVVNNHLDSFMRYAGETLTDHENWLRTLEYCLSDKVDKVEGKGLSTNDYTTTEKTKLYSIEEGAEANVQSDWNESNSSADSFIKNKPITGDGLEIVTEYDEQAEPYKVLRAKTKSNSGIVFDGDGDFKVDTDVIAAKSYVDLLLSGALKRKVVQTLPVSDIDTNTVYMVPKTTAGTNNVYYEFMYINSAWEKIGDTEVDLSGKGDKTDMVFNIRGTVTGTVSSGAQLTVSFQTYNSSGNLENKTVTVDDIEEIAHSDLYLYKNTSDVWVVAAGFLPSSYHRLPIMIGRVVAIDDALKFISDDNIKDYAYIGLAKKVDKVSGKGLSTNDYTTAEKTKLAEIEAGANKTVVDDELSSSSTNPVQNKSICEYFSDKVVTPKNYFTPTWQNDYGINASGEKVSLSGSIYAELEVQAGEVYIVQSKPNYNYRCVACRDSNGNLISGYLFPNTSTATTINETITIPDNCVVMAVSSPLGDIESAPFRICKVENSITTVEGATVKYDCMDDEVKPNFAEIPIFEQVDYTASKTGYYITNIPSYNYEYFQANSDFYNGLISVSVGERYRIKGTYSNYCALYMLFDNNGKFISRYPTSNTSPAVTEEVEIVIPDGCVAMGVSGTSIPIVKKATSRKIIVNNSLVGKKIALNGDSICANNTVTSMSYGYQIANENYMTIKNVAVGGGTIAYGTTSGGNNRHWICNTISSMPDDADYILFEGGINDYWLNVPLGAITSTMTDTIDNTTFYGALESICRQALNKWTNKKIGFVITHKINSTWRTNNSNSNTFADFHQAILDVCEKYSIPVCDLYNTSTFNTELSAYLPYTTDDDNSSTGNGVHPTTEGYKLFYVDKITSFLKSL